MSKKYCAEHEFTYYDSECYYCRQNRERGPPHAAAPMQPGPTFTGSTKSDVITDLEMAADSCALNSLKGSSKAALAAIAEIKALQLKLHQGELRERELGMMVKSAQDNLARLLEQRDAALKDLDEASPMRTCARCGKQDRTHRMMIEEGDEWECEEDYIRDKPS